MVVALGAHGHEVSRSRIVTVTTGGDVDRRGAGRPRPAAGRRRRLVALTRAPRAPAPLSRPAPAAPCRARGVASPPMESEQPEPTAAPDARAARAEATRSIEGITDAFREQGYIAERSLATTVFLALELGRPLLLEGEAGVGKTELAKVLAATLGSRLIRLQCYEGLDVNTAVYEWNYPRQMLEIRLLEARGEIDKASAHDIFGPEFLLKRPLLQALESTDGSAPVLLIDEIDRADEEFEAYLLEILSDFQVTVPEIGTIRAAQAPRVVLTSNRTREVHDALKRRCLYHWIDYPTAAKEFEIVSTRVPDAPPRLAREVVDFVHRLRAADLTKVPGVAETLDWAAALLSLGAAELSPDVVDETLGVVLKYEEDIRQVRGAVARQYLAEATGAGLSIEPASRLRRRPWSCSRPPARSSTGAGCWPRPSASGGRCAPRGSPSTSAASIDFARALTLRRHRQQGHRPRRGRRAVRAAARRPRGLRPGVRAVLAPPRPEAAEAAARGRSCPTPSATRRAIRRPPTRAARATTRRCRSWPRWASRSPPTARRTARSRA